MRSEGRGYETRLKSWRVPQPRRVLLGNCCSIRLSYGGTRTYEALAVDSTAFRMPQREFEVPTGNSDILEEMRSEEHTSELQSHSDLVCRLLLEKKKEKKQKIKTT